MYTPLPLVEGVLSPVPPGPTVPIKCYLGNVGFQMKRTNWRRKCSRSTPSDKAGMHLEIDKLQPEEIVGFLAINPMVASVELYDRLDKADECARTGNDHSLAHAYVEAHAARQKQLHREWTDLPRDTPGWRHWVGLWDVQYIAEGFFDAWRNPPGSEDDSDKESENPDHEQVPVQPQ